MTLEVRELINFLHIIAKKEEKMKYKEINFKTKLCIQNPEEPNCNLFIFHFLHIGHQPNKFNIKLTPLTKKRY